MADIAPFVANLKSDVQSPERHREGADIEAAMSKIQVSESYSLADMRSYLSAIRPLLSSDANMNAEAKQMLADTEIVGLAVAQVKSADQSKPATKQYLLELNDAKTHEARGILDLSTGTVFFDTQKLKGQTQAEKDADAVTFWGQQNKRWNGVSRYGT